MSSILYSTNFEVGHIRLRYQTANLVYDQEYSHENPELFKIAI